MLLEDILLLMLLASGVFLIGVPTFKFVHAILPKKNNLAEAKERLEQARLDAEAARLNKEAEKLYQEIYEDCQDEDKRQEKSK